MKNIVHRAISIRPTPSPVHIITEEYKNKNTSRYLRTKNVQVIFN